MGSGRGAPVPAGRGSPGSPRCGSRRTPLSASRGGASPGGTALPERPRCAPLSPGPRPEKLRGDPTRGRCVGRRRGTCPSGLLTLRPGRPRVAPLPVEARLEAGGWRKKPTGRRVYKKQPTKRRLWQISISLLFPAPAAVPPSRLPCLRSEAATWSPPPPALPLPGSGEAGRSPSFPGGTGPSLPLTFPCPLARAGRGPVPGSPSWERTRVRAAGRAEARTAAR